MKTSIATVSISGNLREKLEAIAAAGYDGIEIFEQDLVEACNNAEQLIEDRCPDNELPLDIQHVIVEMVYQLGIGGVGKFNNMWLALNQADYYTASQEMQDSRWHKQTKKRCESLAKIVESFAE